MPRDTSATPAGMLLPLRDPHPLTPLSRVRESGNSGLPSGFHFAESELWVALQLESPQQRPPRTGCTGIGRLRVGATEAQAQRTPEIGVRMALGARPEAVRRLVLGQALRLVGIGVVVGTLAAIALTRFLASLPYGASAVDPLIALRHE